jgi:D-cysteine desulfhydrase
MPYDALSALDRLPRLALLEATTAIHPLSRIEQKLGLAARGIRLSIKRDDVMALGGGGNKLRKLEYHLGHARDSGVAPFATASMCCSLRPAGSRGFMRIARISPGRS